ncbi:Carboxylesterase [Ostertagia ostertagi]
MEPWEGVKRCRQFGNRSIQEDMLWDKFTIFTPQSEDCLYLNIFAPAIDPTKSYPVMFYIHGGGFMMDSAVRYKPENMARLIALKWTKENIHHFGGDPNRITVAGQSAGAVSADLLSLSPLSRGMFNRKIVMGGNFLLLLGHPPQRRSVLNIAGQKALKAWLESPDKRCLTPSQLATFSRISLEGRGKPRHPGFYANSAGSKVPQYFFPSIFPLIFPASPPFCRLGIHMVGNDVFFNEARLPLAPVIDGEILPKAIPELRAEAPPMESLTGVGRAGILSIQGTGKDMDRLVHEFARQNQLHVTEVEELVERVYGNLDELRRDRKAMQDAYSTCLSDTFANYGCQRYLEHSQHHDKSTYAYRFDYTSRNMWGWLAVMVPYLTGTHCSDVIYLFDCNYFTAPLPMTKKDRKISKMTSSSFMEFVKTGSPSHLPCKWEPVGKTGEIRSLSISEKPTMIGEMFDNRIQRIDDFLKEILSRRSRDQSS